MVLETKKLTLEEYKKLIESLSKRESDLIFKNQNHAHAQIVLANLIETSKKKVYIYDDNLSGDVAQKFDQINLYESIRKFVISGKLLSIVVDELGKINDFQTKLIELRNKFPKNLVIKITSEVFKNNIQKSFDKDVNFAIGDTTKFRVEYGDKGKRKAFCSFKNSDFPKKFIQLFEDNISNCQSVVG